MSDERDNRSNGLLFMAYTATAFGLGAISGSMSMVSEDHHLETAAEEFSFETRQNLLSHNVNNEDYCRELGREFSRLTDHYVSDTNGTYEFPIVTCNGEAFSYTVLRGNGHSSKDNEEQHQALSASFCNDILLAMESLDAVFRPHGFIDTPPIRCEGYGVMSYTG